MLLLLLLLPDGRENKRANIVGREKATFSIPRRIELSCPIDAAQHSDDSSEGSPVSPRSSMLARTCCGPVSIIC